MEKLKKIKVILWVFIVCYLILTLAKFKFSNGVFDLVSLGLLLLGVLQSNYMLLKIYPIINFFAVFDSLVTILTKFQREGRVDFRNNMENLLNILSIFFYPICCYAVFEGYKELKGIDYDTMKNEEKDQRRKGYTELANKDSNN